MTYVPPFPSDQSPEDLAIEEFESRMGDYGLHGVYKGKKLVNGQPTGQLAVTCLVSQKGMVSRSKRLEPSVKIDGQHVLIDVVEEKPQQILRLPIPPHEAQAILPQQKCYNSPIPMGVRIAPRGKDWVGSAGAVVRIKDQYYILTNEHVSGLGALGEYLCQPLGNSDWVGKFEMVGGVRFSGPNYIDAALANCYRTDGPFAPGTHTAKPEMLTLGRIKPQPQRAEIDMPAQQEGQTIGTTKGRCIGVNGTFNVGYEGGAAQFRGQDVYKAFSGQFSVGGHSGTVIYTMDNRPMSLLFAGGGGTTIGNPIHYVLDWCKGEFF